MKNTLLYTLFAITLLCISQITQATNIPSTCTANLTLLTSPSQVVVGGTVDLYLYSANAPALLISYDVYLYQNGVLVRSVPDVEFTVIGEEPFYYTFTGVVITNQSTVFYAVIEKDFIILPLVFIQTNNLTVTARIPTNTTLDRSMPNPTTGTGIIGNSGSPFLCTKLFVYPPVPAGSNPITDNNEQQICETFINGDTSPDLNSSLFLARDTSPSLDFHGNCALPAFLNAGDNYVVNVFYPGDTTYAPSSCQVSFTIRSDFNYVASEITVTYPTNIVVRDLVATKNKSRKAKKVKKVTKPNKTNNRRRRSVQ